MIVLSIFSFWWFGYELITLCIQNRWQYISRLLAGFSIGVLYQSLISFMIQYVIGWHEKLSTIVVTIFLALSLMIHLWNRRLSPSYVISMTRFDFCVLIINIIFTSYRISQHNLENGRTTRGASWGDMTFQLQIASSFSVGPNQHRNSLFGIKNPIYHNVTFAYPVLPDFYCAYLFSACGASNRNSILWTSMINGISFVYFLHYLALKLTNSSVSASLVFPLWYFAAGLGFTEIFEHPLEKNWVKYNYIFSFSSISHVMWFPQMSHSFLSQRCTTFALPVCIIVILFLIDGSVSYHWGFFVAASIGVAVLPQTQAHAFVAIATYSISYALISFLMSNNKLKVFKAWLLFGICANSLAIPLSLPLLKRVSNESSFCRIAPLWKDKTFTHPPYPFFRLWWTALGSFGFISLFTGFVTSDKKLIIRYIPAICVFLLSNYVVFSPWARDNCKAIQDGWLPLAVAFVAQFLERTWKLSKHIIIKVMLVFIYLSCIASGLLAFFLQDLQKVEIANPGNVNCGRWAIENMPVDSVISHRRIHDVPHAVFGGKAIFYGWGFWIESHGMINTTMEKISNDMETGIDASVYIEMGSHYVMKIMLPSPYETYFDKSDNWEEVSFYYDFKMYKLRLNTIINKTISNQNKKSPRTKK